MKTKEVRNNGMFLRNEFDTCGKWEIPRISKDPLVKDPVRLLACADTRPDDCEANKECGVHFFVDDYRFTPIYKNPESSLAKYSQYRFLLSPDFSLYAEMPLWRQLESVAQNRWCGAFWQSKGLLVYPTISWSTASSFEFCFDGVENGSTVAVGMIGCKSSRKAFMYGYDAMLERLSPSSVIVFGGPFPEMRGDLITVDYLTSRKAVR